MTSFYHYSSIDIDKLDKKQSNFKWKKKIKKKIKHLDPHTDQHV